MIEFEVTNFDPRPRLNLMIRDMEKLGSGRKSFSLTSRPPKLFKSSKKGVKKFVEIFEPYEENLPLEAGYYSFVLDEMGKFRIKRGNYSSHASFVSGKEVGAAGQFRINRAGNVAEVFTRSVDYWLNHLRPESPTVDFVIDSFRNHHALEVSKDAIFHFKRDRYDGFLISLEKQPILDRDDRLLLLETEGQGGEILVQYSSLQKAEFQRYRPEPPPRLYGILLDQMTLDLESEQLEPLEVGVAKRRLDETQPLLSTGKKAFIIDQDGWLIVGHGHHILSGNRAVGAAGQIVINSQGEIAEINLNFSGHYRPALTGQYARYTYRNLRSHPLLKFSNDCQITGRKFDESTLLSVKLKFNAEELLATTRRSRNRSNMRSPSA